MLLIGFIFHEPILLRVGQYLVVSDDIERADVIRVLGGSPDRYLYGAELYKQGMGERLVFSLWDDYVPLLQRSKVEIIREYATAEGISADKVDYLEAISTFHEAEMTLELIENQQLDSVIIVSSPYHMRRASIIFDHVIGDKADLIYTPVPNSWTDFRIDWWRSEESTVAVLHEYIAIAYYFVKYIL